MKKIFALILSVFMVMSLITVSFASEYTYLDKAGWKAVANTTNKSFVADKMLDGNIDTYWHSDYRNENDMDKPPFYLTFTLPEAQTIGGWRYIPRTSNASGIVTEYNIYVSDAEEGKAEFIYSGRMENSYDTKEIPFGFNVKNVKTVILEITEGMYNYGVVAEFDLIKEIPEKETKSIKDSARGNKTIEIGTNKIDGSASEYYEDKASWKVSASSAHKRNGIEKAFDDNKDTIWHSDYTDDGVATVLTKVEGPHVLEIILPYERYISGFTYLPRTGQTTGIFTGYELYGAITDDGDWVLLKSGEWKGDYSEKREDFLKNLKVKKVKLVSTSTVSGFGTCAEFDLKTPSEKLENEEDLASYESFFMANKVDRIDLSGASAKATSEWEGKNPAMRVVDGNQRVAWHSDPSDKDKFPIILTVDLGDVYTVSEIEYAPRIDDTTKHGIWTDFSVWASTDGEDYSPAIENTGLELTLDNQKIKFEKPVTARFFEFEINEGYRGYATCGDLFFYERAVDTEERETTVKEKYILEIDSKVIKTEKDGASSEKTIDVVPFIDSGYTQIPLRGLLEEMGASLTWDGEHQKIDITGEGIKIEMQIMNDAVYVTNSKLGRVRYTLQTPPQIKDSRTFVPLRFISENLGYKVEWNGETREITITK